MFLKYNFKLSQIKKSKNMTNIRIFTNTYIEVLNKLIYFLPQQS